MTDVEWVPAFPGQRPPFTTNHPAIAQPGNSRALLHGFHSERVLAPIAKQLLDEVLAVPANAYLTELQWRPELAAWARAEAQVLAVTAYLERAAQYAENGTGDLDSDRVRTAYALLHRAEARAASGRTRLGLSPLSRARLGRDVAAAGVDVAELLTRMAEASKGATQ